MIARITNLKHLLLSLLCLGFVILGVFSTIEAWEKQNWVNLTVCVLGGPFCLYCAYGWFKKYRLGET